MASINYADGSGGRSTRSPDALETAPRVSSAARSTRRREDAGRARRSATRSFIAAARLPATPVGRRLDGYADAGVNGVIAATSTPDPPMAPWPPPPLPRASDAGRWRPSEPVVAAAVVDGAAVPAAPAAPGPASISVDGCALAGAEVAGVVVADPLADADEAAAAAAADTALRLPGVTASRIARMIHATTRITVAITVFGTTRKEHRQHEK